MFSEIVDRAVSLTGRPDCLADIVYSANETIRELSKREDWGLDSVEEMVHNLTPNGTFVWTPSVGRARFRRMEYICDVNGNEPTFVKPSRRMSRMPCCYYQSGDSFVFKGVQGPLLAYYYAYPRWLQYYPQGQRPAEYTAENGWGAATEEQVELVSNWLLEHHNFVVLAGTLAKFFAAKQDPRQTVHYSQFEQGFNHMISGEHTGALAGNRHG